MLIAAAHESAVGTSAT